jgi:hypothetical protein
MKKEVVLQINDSVKIADRYFHNHGVKVIDLGTGTIQGILEVTEHFQPRLLIRFAYAKEFATVKLLRDLLVTNGRSEHKSVLVAIHPLYVERIVKKNGRVQTKSK